MGRFSVRTILNAKTRRNDAKEIYDSKTLRLSVVAPLRSKKIIFGI